MLLTRIAPAQAWWLSMLAVLSVSSAAGTTERHLALADFGAETTLSNAVLSPDGSRIAVIVARADYLDNRTTRSLVLIDVATGARKDLLPTRSSVSAPKWSPAGDRLAWLDRAQGGRSQVHVMSMTEQEPASVWSTNVAQGVSSYAWSPDGRTLAFRSSDEPEGRPPHDRAFEVMDNDFLATAPLAPSWLGVVSVGADDARRVSSGDGNVKGFVWLADGRSIAYTTTPKANHGYEETSLNILDIVDGTLRVRLPPESTRAAPLLSLVPASPTRPEIAFLKSRGAQPEYTAAGVELVGAAAEGRGRDITSSVDRSFRELQWLADGEGFVATAADGTRDGAWLFSMHDVVKKLDLGPVRQMSSLSIGKHGALAFIGREERRADEVYLMKSAAGKPVRLTDFNDTLARLSLGRVERVRWQLDGFEQSGVLVCPPGFRRGQRYPLVLNIHGGPMSTSSEAFDMFNQLLAAQGWLVLSPNYRGSRSDGNAFQSAVIDDPVDGPTRDVMAGIDAVKRLGIVDEDKLAVSGWSYGGFLTTWLTIRYPVWRAAVAAAAVTDWADNYSYSDMNVFFGHGMGGSAWRKGQAEYYWRQSPLSRVDEIRTPMLILSTTGDVRVPVPQSYKLHRALQDNGVPVQFIAYAMGGHAPDDPVNRRDWYRRWMEWIQQRFTVRDGASS